jgi:hypothetical protein
MDAAFAADERGSPLHPDLRRHAHVSHARFGHRKVADGHDTLRGHQQIEPSRATRQLRIRARGTSGQLQGPAFARSVRTTASRSADVRNLESRPRRSRRRWHNRAMSTLLLALLFTAPWLAAIAWVWPRAPKMDRPPPSLADRTRERLWAA